MPITATAVRTESYRRLRRLRIQIGDDLRRLRLDAGTTLTSLASVTGVDRSHLRRIESGEANASVEALVAIGIALGADLGLRYFAGVGPRLVDRFQAPMIEGFLPQLAKRWMARLELSVKTPTRGVVDAALIDRQARPAVAGEFQSEFRRIEQQIRWSNEKAEGLLARLAEEDGEPMLTGSQLLVGAVDSGHSRTRPEVRGHLGDCLSREDSRRPPCPHDRACAVARCWRRGMRVENGRGELMEGPPRGVRLGR